MTMQSVREKRNVTKYHYIRLYAVTAAMFFIPVFIHLSARSVNQIYNTPAVEMPESAAVSFFNKSSEEGDEIDVEIEKYFQRLQSGNRIDVDQDKLNTFLRTNSRILKENAAQEEDGAVSFSNINSNSQEEQISAFQTHEVRTGDTIYAISRLYQVTPESIVRNNPELTERPLYIGEELLISRAEETKVAPVAIARYHNVSKGESLYGIAKSYKINMNTLYSLNGLNEKSVISPGQRIKVGESKALPAGYTYAPLFKWPIEEGRITSQYGTRLNPFLRSTRQFHRGIDVGAPMGTPIHAARDGIVILSGRMGGYGNVIFVRHTEGYITVYAHNRGNLVNAGDIVKQGQKVAEVGRTGSATGPHLHFEVRRMQKPINPVMAMQLKEIVPTAQLEKKKDEVVSRIP